MANYVKFKQGLKKDFNTTNQPLTNGMIYFVIDENNNGSIYYDTIVDGKKSTKNGTVHRVKFSGLPIKITGSVIGTGVISQDGETIEINTSTNHSHGLAHQDFTVALSNDDTNLKWTRLGNQNGEGFWLKSIRGSSKAPAWFLPNFSAGIAFGGYNTKGIISIKYSQPGIRFAGGNGDAPVWYFTITGSNDKSYDLNGIGGHSSDSAKLDHNVTFKIASTADATNGANGTATDLSGSAVDLYLPTKISGFDLLQASRFQGNADSATYATSAGYAKGLFLNPETRQEDMNFNLADAKYIKRVTYSMATSTTKKNKPPIGDANILSFGWDNSGYGSQLAIQIGGAGHLAVRGSSSTNGASSWGEWSTVLDSSNYTSYINNYYWANVKVSTASSTETKPTFNTAYVSNWWRSTGSTGWWNETHQGGITMEDNTYVKVAGNKSFLIPSGSLKVGESESKFYANSSGNGYFSNTLGIAGINTSYNLYVNGTSRFNNTLYFFNSTGDTALSIESRRSKNSSNANIETNTGLVTKNKSFIEIRGFAPPTMVRTTGDRPAPYGLGFCNGIESAGIMPIGEGDNLRELMFYGANSGLTLFTWKYQTWEDTSYDTNSSNGYSEASMSLNSKTGDLYVKNTVGINGTNTLYNFYVNGTSYFTDYLQTTSYFKSTIATGTAPVQVTSTTLNTNLNADLLDGYHESSFLRHRDTVKGSGGTSHSNSLWSQIGIRQYHNALPDAIADNATYMWGSVVSLPGTNSRLDIWYNHLTSSNGDGLRYRTGWENDKGAWATILDSLNYGTIADGRYVNVTGDTMTGNLTINASLSVGSKLKLWSDGEGGNIRFITPGNANNIFEFDNCGNVLRLYYCTDGGTEATGFQSWTWGTDGSFTAKQFNGYLNGNAASATIASSANKLNTSAGGSTNPIYFENGVPVKSTASVGSANQPVYLNNGVITACVGSQSGTEKQQSFKINSNNRTASWCYLGNLVSNGDNSEVIIDIYTGNGYNSSGNQNTHISIFIKDGWQSTQAAADSFGISYLVDHSDDHATSIKIKGMASAHNVIDLYVYLPWNYSDGYYSIKGYYNTWTNKVIWSTTEPTSGEVQNCVFGAFRAGQVYGAVWNDYAEYRRTKNNVQPGYCVIETGKGDLIKSSDRLQPGANIVSDTFGFAIGETEQIKTPLAVSGRVLAYPYEDRDSYQAGDPVCSGPNGTISKMTREEVREYPDRIIGTVSEIPDYEVWGTGNVKVNNRIWIKVK